MSSSPICSNPQIDVRVFSNGALFLRNENVTVRADADIHVNGPLAAANVTGDIGITQSRFFKQIEILPLELPGRPAPKPPPAPETNPRHRYAAAARLEIRHQGPHQRPLHHSGQPGQR